MIHTWFLICFKSIKNVLREINSNENTGIIFYFNQYMSIYTYDFKAKFWNKVGKKDGLD